MTPTSALQKAIYHEKQERGSMLCAQHALNSLLQENYFTAADLSMLATSLDELEAVHNPSQAGQPSRNQDDTGFFSIQVLESALEAFQLNLVRWRSEAMRPYHNEPHNQRAFVLNLDQHWFTLRRFGDEWYNLNSTLPAPAPIGKLYLGMVLQQSEDEGYSVFVVLPSDPTNSQPFPRCRADELAEQLSATGTPNPVSRSSENPTGGTEWSQEDEDMELQAALQASLASSSSHEPSNDVPTPTRGTSMDSSAASRTNWPGNFGELSSLIPGLSTFGQGAAPRPQTTARGLTHDDDEIIDVDDDEEEEYHRAREQAARARAAYLRAREGMIGAHDDLAEEDDPDPATADDPVAASMARTQRMLARMQRQQEAALAIGGSGPSERERQRRQEEEDALQRAIEESRQMYEQSSSAHKEEKAQPARPTTEDEAWDEAEQALLERQVWEQHRVYDDEDEELQAALRASLESGAPASSDNSTPPPQPVSAPNPPPTSGSTNAKAPLLQRQGSTTSDAYETESEAGTEEMAAPEPVDQAAIMAEMRRKRLERFGQ